MIEFSLAYALAVIFFSAFLPGAVLSLGILKKSDFSLLEKILVGFALGLVLQGFLPFFEFLILGMKFSYGLALLNTGIVYALALGVFAWKKAHEDIGTGISLERIRKNPFEYVIPALVLLLFALNFFIRIQTLSPIYQELDPYYYIYVTQQIVTHGFNPLDDKTAWYPEVAVDHRAVPLISYMEAGWYSLYSKGGEYNNYILSLVSNIYPPFAAAFAAFFLYLGLRAWYRKEYAFIASAVASFVPMFLMKLLAGEAEIQPYAFFALSMFFAFFLWAHRKQDLFYMALAGAGYFTVSMGSSSEVVAATVFLIFTALQALTLFLAKREIETFAKLNLVFLAFPVFAALLKSAFVGYMVISYAAANTAMVAFVFVLYFIQKSKFDFEAQFYALGGIMFAAMLLFAFTPLGSLVKSIALTGLQIAEYTLPLHRTIAEQGTTGAVLEPSLGFIGKIFDHGIYQYIGIIFALPSLIANIAFAAFSAALNAVFGTNLSFDSKENSVAMALLFFSFVASAYSIYRMVAKKEESIAWFFVALIFPIALVGLIKAKYIIYLGFALSAAIAFVFGELEALILEAAKIADASRKYVFYSFIVLGFIIATLQFSEGLAPMLLKSSFSARFQDNPSGFQEKFSVLCDELRLKGISESDMADVCEAGRDAVAYANKGINDQYNSQLCALSLIKDPFNADEAERTAAAYRCERVSVYWIESMEWVRYNTENDSRITSWWDYGHWENFFGQRNAVIRNEHVSHNMIVEIAHDYTSGTPEELKQDMLRYDSKYALFDAELLLSGNSFGGKYGALNYLACARNNQTNVSRVPGSSQCEYEHLWSQVYIPASPGPQDECSISFNQKGITAYALVLVQSGSTANYNLVPKYCAGSATLATGQNTTALYELDKRAADGALKMHKAFLKLDSQDKKWNVYTLFYTRDTVWIENGTISDGWADRGSKFYDSNLYNAFILEDLPGFELVYKTKDGMVKIFKIKKS